MKPRLIAYVDPKLHTRVAAARAKPGWSQSALATAVFSENDFLRRHKRTEEEPA